MKNIRAYVFLVVILLLLVIVFSVNNNTYKFNIEAPNEMNENWVFDDDNIILPTDLNIPINESYTITTTLSEDFHEQQFLLIRSSLQNIRVTLDNQIIYQETYGDTLLHPYASLWHLVEIPHQSEGLSLAITLSSPYTNMSGQVNAILYGTEAMLLGHLFRTYGALLAISLLVFVAGLAVIVTDFFNRKKQAVSYAYAGLFAILLSLWMFAESRMMQFFTGSELMIGSLAYLVIPLFPIPLITHLDKYVIKNRTLILRIIQLVFVIQFLLIVSLYAFQVAGFFQTVLISQIVLAINVFIMLGLLIIEVVKHHNQKALQFIKAFGILVFFGMIELFNFMFGFYHNTSLYVSIGVAILMAILVINYSKYIIERIATSREKEFYEKLAYMDYITQGKNRLAFERDLEEIIKDTDKYKNLRLVLFDLDELKSINDAYGHIEGDQAIKNTYDIITRIFGDFGECYRIGGDEFACLYVNNSEKIYQQKIIDLTQEIKIYNEMNPYHFGTSFGSAVPNKKNMDTKELMRLADLNMYENKKNKK